MDPIVLKAKIKGGSNIFDMNLKVTFYARVSTDKDVQLNSLGNQIYHYEELIKGNPNWTFVDGYIDEGISGKSAEKRTNFMRMIRDAKNQKFDFILTKEISRFSRSTLDSIKYTQDLLRYGVGVFFENDNINTFDTDSELRLTIMSSIAQDELRRLSERLRFGYERSIEKGRVLGQDNILGYDKMGGNLSINENEAKIVRRIFQIYLEGKLGIRLIARQLEQEGLLNPATGKPLAYATISNIIQNPKYKGFYCSRKTISMDYRNNRQIHQPKEQWITHQDDNIPAIVSPEEWDAANKLYEQRGEIAKNNGMACQNRYSFSGKIVCGEHGTSYHRHIYKSKKNGEQEVWNCKLYRLKGKRDGCDSPTIYSHELFVILNDIYKAIYDEKEKVIDGLMKLYGTIEVADYSKDIENIENDIDSLNAKKDKLLELAMEGTITKEEFKQRNERMNLTLAELNDKMAKINATQEHTANHKQWLSALKKSLDQEFSNTDNFVAEASSQLLDKIVVHKIDGDKRHVRLEIRLKIGKTYTADYEKDKSILLREMGISQAQVSRLEKSALTRIKKQI